MKIKNSENGRSRNIKMRFGLIFLTLGFTLQFASNWIN
jgi:hypothetical protein